MGKIREEAEAAIKKYGADPIVPPLLGLSGFWQAVDHLSLWVQKDIPFQIQIPGSPPVKFAENPESSLSGSRSERRRTDTGSVQTLFLEFSANFTGVYPFFPVTMTENIRFIKIPESAHHMEDLIQGLPHFDQVNKNL